MKVGLLTFHDTTNFGSFLQTLGLYKAVSDIGIDCEIIDYQCEAIRKTELPAKRPKAFNLKKIAAFILFEPTKKAKYCNLLNETKRLMHISRDYDVSNIKEANNNYDVFLVGSDILWGLDITKGDLTYFLDFVNDDKKKYAFSVSVGNCWSEIEKKKVFPLVSRFKIVATRELEASRWVEEVLHRDIPVVCDPTMLIEPMYWVKMAQNSGIDAKLKQQEYILIYFTDKEDKIVSDAMKLARKKGLKVFFINYGIPLRGVKNIRPTKVNDFLSYILNATYVLTASYHGMLYSIYFRKQFYFYNRAHGSRMNSVAQIFDLKKRNSEFLDTENIKKINYDYVDVKVNEFRFKSLNILRTYFEKGKDDNGKGKDTIM